MESAALGIADQVVPVPAHIGLFYDAATELSEARLAFLRPALEDRRQGIMLLAPPGIAEQALRDLEEDFGRSLGVEIRSGQVIVAHYDNDPDLLLENIRDALTTLAARGFDVIRVFAQVMWGAPGFPLPEDHLWVESRVNNLVAELPVLMVCAYDVSQLPDRALISGGLETHPSVVIGGHLTESPNYLAPAAYMRSFLIKLKAPGP